jgi:hypothetical protein
VTGVLEEKPWIIIQGQNHLKHLQDGSLPWVTAVAVVLVTYKNWLPLEDIHNAEWIQQQCFEEILYEGACEIREERRN